MKASDIITIGGLQKFEAESVRKPSGAIILDGMHLADTLQCCHCGKVWIPIRGSGIKRGFCMKCNKVTCGSHECNECIPFARKLDMYEKGKLKRL